MLAVAEQLSSLDILKMECFRGGFEGVAEALLISELIDLDIQGDLRITLR